MDIITNSMEDEVRSVLIKTDASFASAPDYTTFDRDRVVSHMRSVAGAVEAVTGTPGYNGVDEALDRTIGFVQNSFDVYEGKVAADQRDWVFAVPARTARAQGNEYASEITPFLPVLDPKFGVNSDVRQRAVVGLAPSVIENYGGQGDTTGAIVYTPLYEDMQFDYDRAADRLRVSRENIQKSAEFVRRRLGARVMGLGAVIPSLTRYGKDINEEGLTVTTGHGGTVHLVSETVSSLAERRSEAPHIGIIGAAGSIGKSSLDTLLAGEFDAASYMLSDINHMKLSKIAAERTGNVDITVGTNSDVLKASDIIVAAVTTQIDLDRDEYADLDLTGKVIVDDSQPGCFSREQVEARGGKLVWVVGNDTSENRSLRRLNNYTFGDTAGLYGESSVWGCEAEAASIAIENRPDLAISGPVTPEQAAAIGGLCRSIGVTSPKTFESFSRPVEL